MNKVNYIPKARWAHALSLRLYILIQALRSMEGLDDRRMEEWQDGRMEVRVERKYEMDLLGLRTRAAASDLRATCVRQRLFGVKEKVTD